ncbi:type I-E CRISPR-associated protein Cas6/Cse3/CasE [Paracoccus spongiarum]|uniref:Type I-E CRISPR-associated protein Cas6/Cse3/CasE n=1 Tax=Paracoccus spongiarum TaxID=3064387 RepID=A0ABT9JBB8_9RHOB|nr:type I-E CRISPR-associated protein Cas6/Cse3/CasE [Paracoccus sp. 2205BS29-5]MDP5306421.1 type I-E CRISPR-associated protein Cas6/Cse3/CasE [Paracoccus sp. 2205BS29-5]
MTLWLSRLRLAHGPDLDALRPLLDPASRHAGGMDTRERGCRSDAHHRLIWTLFADTPDRTRDFLWRDEGGGRFTLLSHRPPAPSRLFESPETRELAPALEPGDRLAFTLRANATRTVKSTELAPNGKRKRKHIDLVMDRLRPLPGQRDLPPGVESERPKQRLSMAQDAATEWLGRQGVEAGFVPDDVTVGDYSTAALPGHVGRRKGQPQYGILDMSGSLTVTDPAVFVEKLGQGFGRARGFGCGLMLIRRA